jgi:pSer/pThr/pTyr-binding forkhead associated (FHA) protein
MAYAHRAGVIHRDLKPANILLDDSGRARITDFGIAHLEESNLTREGVVLGSPGYSAPEHLRGQPVDARAEVFSLGVIIYYLLTGSHPFPGTKLKEVMQAVLESDPAPPSTIVGGVDRGWDELLAGMLAKDPEQRLASMDEVKLSLEDLTGRPAGAEDEGPECLSLLVVSGPDVGQRFPLLETTIRIGRRTGGIQLKDPEVSGRHCELTQFGGRLLIKDLNSTNGTRVEGKRIEVEELAVGGSFRVGQTTLRLERTTEPIADRSAPKPSTTLTSREPATTTRRAMRPLGAPPRYELVMLQGHTPDQRFELPLGRTVVGRNEGDIALYDLRVSRKHAEVEVRGAGQVMVRDLASSNGTTLNNEPVINAALKPGDILGFGDTLLRLDEKRD